MAEWAPRSAHAAPPQAPDSGEDENEDEGSLVFEDGARAIDRRLTPREKLARGGLACLAILLTAFVALGGPAATGALLASLRPLPAAPRIAVAAAAHYRAPLSVLPAPDAASTSFNVRIRPAAGNRGDAYACWASFRPARQMRFAVLPSGGSQWIHLNSPAPTGTHCNLAADTVRETWVVMAVYVTSSDTSCVLPQLFLSSTGGHSWERVPWPNQWLSACDVTLTLADGRLYASAADPLLIRNAFEIGAPERIMTTADAGKTWQVADIGLPFASNELLAGVRPGGHLLAETSDSAEAATGTLWESATNGASWDSLGQLPGLNPVVAVSADPTVTDEGGWGRLYVVAARSAGGAPGGQETPLVETGFPGAGWSQLTLPPPQDDASGRVENQIMQAVVGPADSLTLLIEGPDSNHRAFAPPDYIWTWNPARRTWHQASFLAPGNTLFQGMAWDANQSRVWMTQINLDFAPPPIVVVTFSLTATGAA